MQWRETTEASTIVMLDFFSWVEDKWAHLMTASWEICMQVKKQQLELDMEQQTGSKLGKEYIKAVCFAGLDEAQDGQEKYQ